MKFARYLQDAQTPEWKKAYIDYRGLKVQLGIIQAHDLQQTDTSTPTVRTSLGLSHDIAPIHETMYKEPEELRLGQGNTTSISSLWVPGIDPAGNSPTNSGGHTTTFPMRQKPNREEKPSLSLALTTLPPRVTWTTSTAPSQQTPLPPRTPRSPPVFPLFRDSGSPTPAPLHTILSNLPAIHIKFFDMLNAELDKVETFYAEREKEMHERAKRLREQLCELGVHRQILYRSSAPSKAQNWKKAQFSVPSALSSLVSWLQGRDTKPDTSYQIGGVGILASESGRGGRRGVVDTSSLSLATEHVDRNGDHSRPWKNDATEQTEIEKDPESFLKNNSASSPKGLNDTVKTPPRRSNSLSIGGTKNPLDPHEYQHAKRRLRKAVVEHYRGLEVLNNYRILNLTGFRKALKKYEKITKNLVLDAYMKEKVEPSAFASGAMVCTMLKEMEDIFATRFERGDKKKAMDRLRIGPFSKTHHLSTFRSGLWLGLALPAIGGGAYLSFQHYLRGSLPSWYILLFIYSVLIVPVLLALLIGVNIAVWKREKINYVFIFDLNPRSRLDHHEYFELPSFLFCTLALAFWFSLNQIGPPMLWPLIWIILALVVLFNPFRVFMWGHARWWIIKNTAKLGASGIWKVEFTDFWLADQLCSLQYSFSNLFFVGCFYTRYFSDISLWSVPFVENPNQSLYASPAINGTMPYTDTTVFRSWTSRAYDPRPDDIWSKCGATHNWGWYYLLGSLPFLVRFVQSLRRYWDSRLPTHLINAGKYGMGMIYYFFYYHWRHQEDPRVGAAYILWCFTASAYALYGCAWDVLMDWSMCKSHAQYPLLRTELIFKTQIPSYYFALISNVCIRFLWLTYVPTAGPNLALRTFITAMLEMLRRVQWNFYRLENEHLGNMDQYRVTREVPLPYSFEMNSNEEEEEHEDDEPLGVDASASPGSGSWWKKYMGRSRPNGGHG